VKKDGDEGSTLRSADLLDEELAVAEDTLCDLTRYALISLSSRTR
jgi:hypothetical protein